MYINNIINLEDRVNKNKKWSNVSYEEYEMCDEERQIIEDHYAVQDLLRRWEIYKKNSNKIVQLFPLF